MGDLTATVHDGPTLRRCCGKHPCDGSGQREQILQRRPEGHRRVPDVAPPIVHDVLAGPGRPLTDHVRSDMGARFGHDLSGVRIHTETKAAASASAVSARAYTVGQHVVFGSGEYRPETTAGRSVLAHELAHTIQQRGTGAPGRSSLRVGAVDDAAEREAGAVATEVSSGRSGLGSRDSDAHRSAADLARDRLHLRHTGPLMVPPGREGHS
jgi:hypothetical protein